jgi:Protein of unknown function (DUF1360)
VQHRDPRPLGGYAAILSVYTGLVGGLVLALRRHRGRIEPLDLKQLAFLGLATQHLSRLVTKDSVSSVIRSPFTRFVEPAGEGEVNEEPVGTGLRHAVGELISCPFCVAQWVATGLLAGRIAAPRLTDTAVGVLAVAQISDFLQLGYGALRKLS